MKLVFFKLLYSVLIIPVIFLMCVFAVFLIPLVLVLNCICHHFQWLRGKDYTWGWFHLDTLYHKIVSLGCLADVHTYYGYSALRRGKCIYCGIEPPEKR